MSLSDELVPVVTFTVGAAVVGGGLGLVLRRKLPAAIMISGVAELLATSFITLFHGRTSLNQIEVVLLFFVGPAIGLILAGTKVVAPSYPGTESGFVDWLRDNHKSAAEGADIEALRTQFYQTYGDQSR